MFHKPSNIEVIGYVLIFFMRAAKYYTIYIIQESCLQLLYYIYILYMYEGWVQLLLGQIQASAWGVRSQDRDKVRPSPLLFWNIHLNHFV